MRSPYPRYTVEMREFIARERASWKFYYRTGLVVLMIGVAALVVDAISLEEAVLIPGAVLGGIGLVWRTVAQSSLLKLKGLGWPDCPNSARVGAFLRWYSSAPDNTPYAALKHTDIEERAP